ncbi:hypothetical protein [Actinomadura vinacea]
MTAAMVLAGLVGIPSANASAATSGISVSKSVTLDHDWRCHRRHHDNWRCRRHHGDFRFFRHHRGDFRHDRGYFRHDRRDYGRDRGYYRHSRGDRHHDGVNVRIRIGR